MHDIKKALLPVVALVMMATVQGKPVDKHAALLVAGRYLPQTGLRAVDIGGLYVVEPVDGEGFVLVAGDDCVRPVLAYSTTGHFELEQMPAHVAAWIDGYRREIASLVEAGAIPSEAVAAQWSDTMPKPKSGTADSVAPLLSTEWDQAPYYNDLCPYDEDYSVQTPTGCVATAMAQIMKYWNHPSTGWGSHTYNSNYRVESADFGNTTYQWDTMPNRVDYDCDSTSRAAVAELMYHVGVSMEMAYAPEGSGAQVVSYSGWHIPSAEEALKTYFRYNPLLYGAFKDGYSDAEWTDMIRGEIAAGRPVLYAGYDASAGHAFVLDGYDGTGMFHINWGWGGYQNGYYTIDSLSPGAGGIGGNATYTFNEYNQALIGVEPSIWHSDTVATVQMVADTTMGSIEGNGDYTPHADTVRITAKANDGYRFVGWRKSGSTANPLQFVVNGDMSDTADYTAVGGDTLGYCSNSFYTAWHDDYGTTTAWAIRLPAELRRPARSIDAVEMYVFASGTYTVSIYSGDDLNNATLLYRQPLTATAIGQTGEWQTLMLDESVKIEDESTVWVAMEMTGDGYPATFARYSGNDNGSWYRMPEGWRLMHEATGYYYTNMLRAVMSERMLRVSVELTGESECDLDMVSGTGLYAYGDTATVSIADEAFVHWGNASEESENPTSFVVRADTVLHPYCITLGIDPADGDELRVVVMGRSVTTTHEAELIDTMGRVVARGRRMVAPAEGVYIVRMGTAARRIVVR